MFDYIRSKIIAGPELKKVQEQYKEFFAFLNRYGYSIISKDIRIVHEDNIGYDTDYICVNLIFKRNADFVSISKYFFEQTKKTLPLYPDLNANQFLGISFIRIYNEWHPYYKVNRIGFEILGSKSTTTYYRMFNMFYNVWPLNGEPHSGCTQEFLDNMHAEAIKACVNDLINSIEYYNTDNRVEDWYINYMKNNHPDAIPILIKDTQKKTNEF